MNLLFKVIAAVVFVLFFDFALKNTQEASLNFALGYQLHGPFVLLLLAFFVLGAILGVLAMTPTLLRHRRELAKHKKIPDNLQKPDDVH